MQVRTQNTFLPAHAVGIDIADGSIELVNLGSRRDGTPVVIDAARIVLEPHTITHGVITDEPALDEAFRDLLSKARLSPEMHAVVSALPDEQVIVKTIPWEHAKRLSREELMAHADHAYRLLRIRIRGPVMRWQYHTHHKTNQPELVLYITQQKFIDQWGGFFARHSMRLTALEMESHALARSLLATLTHHEDHERVLLVDFGFRQTNISLFDSAGLCYSHSIDGGGFGLTQALASRLHMTFEQAEAVKQRSRLTGSGANDVTAVLQAAMEETLTAIRASVQSYHRPARSVVITGGGSKLPGLRTMAQKILGRPVKRGSLASLGQQRPAVALDRSPLQPRHAHLYAGALGLALRGADRTSLVRGINFLPEGA